jgi:hypothetical protein
MIKMKKPLLMIKPNSPAFLYVVFALFRFIHWQHFRQRAWNGKRRIKLIGIISLRAALIEDYSGQRYRAWFYWKIGKHYI